MRSAPLLWLVFACSLVACKSETAAPVSPGNVVLEITALRPRDNEVWQPPRAAQGTDPGYPGDPEPIVIGCDRQLGVDVHVEHYYLRAPDACGGNLQCGWLIIDVDPTDTGAAVSGRAASPSLAVDLTPLDAAGELVGPHTLRPRLVQANGQPFTHPYASPPEDLAVTFASDDCPSGGGAGGAGSSEPPSAGGAPNAP
jgi:hypothetical protein